MTPITYTYNADTGTSGQVDLYINPGAPLVFLIQHGAWLVIDKQEEHMLPWITALADDSGYSVACANWRSAPEFLCPVALRDIDSAIRAAERYIAQVSGCARCELYLMGFSSGGHLAYQWALNRAAYGGRLYDPGLRLRGVAAIAGAYDLADSNLGETANLLVDGWMPHAGWKALASPLVHAPLAAGSTTRYLIAHGELDELIPYQSQAVAMYDALDAEGVDVTLLSYADVGHDIGDYESTGWSARLAEYVAWIEA